MSDLVIRIEGLGKQYRLGVEKVRYSTFRDTIQNAAVSTFRSLLRRGPRRFAQEPFWALKNVSFDVKRGDVVGLVGRNGAGKSTLLKILSRITEPTTGLADLYGRVGSLLEVGTGFHHELTGRENTYLNGAILGMRRAEIVKKFDEIVAFAELEKFIDTPVKFYSSGMYMRLAFAVAAHLDPEILIVDEVLAVGDTKFQQRCLGKMATLAKGGRTVLFVSHNLQAVASLATVAILLRDGTVIQSGPVSRVIDTYLAAEEIKSTTRWSGYDGDDDLGLLSAEVMGRDAGGSFRTDEPLRIRLSFKVCLPTVGLVCAIEVFNRTGNRLVYSAVDDVLSPPAPKVMPGIYAWELTIPPNTFAEGTYRIDFDLGIHNVRKVTTGIASQRILLENVAGLGRRLLAASHCNILRPNWHWEPLKESQV